MDGLGFLRGQSTRPNYFLNIDNAEAGHGRGSVRESPEKWSDLIDPLVGALGGEHHGHQQRIGVAVIQRDRCVRVQLGEALIDIVRPGLPGAVVRQCWGGHGGVAAAVSGAVLGRLR